MDEEREDIGCIFGLKIVAIEGSDLTIRRSRTVPGDSFDLIYTVETSGLGTTTHSMHWDTGQQPLEFEDVAVTHTGTDTLLLSFNLASTGTEDPDFSMPVITATFTTGEFTAVPLPPAALGSLGLLGILGVSRRLRQRRKKA